MDFSNVKWQGFEAFSNRLLLIVIVWGALCLLGAEQSAASAGQFLFSMVVFVTLSSLGIRAKGFSGLCVLFLFMLFSSEVYRGVLALFGVHF